jgi:hypothetical protein
MRRIRQLRHGEWTDNMKKNIKRILFFAVAAVAASAPVASAFSWSSSGHLKEIIWAGIIISLAIDVVREIKKAQAAKKRSDMRQSGGSGSVKRLNGSGSRNKKKKKRK